MKHNLIRTFGRNRKGDQRRCSCGKWNYIFKTSSDLETQEMNQKFEFHKLQDGFKK